MYGPNYQSRMTDREIDYVRWMRERDRMMRSRRQEQEWDEYGLPLRDLSDVFADQPQEILKVVARATGAVVGIKIGNVVVNDYQWTEENIVAILEAVHRRRHAMGDRRTKKIKRHIEPEE